MVKPARPWGEIWEGVCVEDQRWMYKRLGCVKNHFTEPSSLDTTVYWRKQVQCTFYVTFELKLSPRLQHGFRMWGTTCVKKAVLCIECDTT